MSEIDASYQPKVGFEQGAETFYIKETGNFKFFDTDYTGEFLRNFMRSNYTLTYTGISNASLISGAATSTVPTLAPAYGYHVINATTAVSKGSCDIQSALAGDIMVIDGQLFESAACVAICQTGINTASLFNARGSRLSSIVLRKTGGSAGTESATNPYLKMICNTSGIWSVVEANNGVQLQGE